MDTTQNNFIVPYHIHNGVDSPKLKFSQVNSFVSIPQSATPAINTDSTDIASIVGLSQAITSFTTNLTGTPVAGQYLMIQITDDGTARALAWGASFVSTTLTLPVTTVISTLLRVGFQWDTVSAKWQLIALV